MRLPSRPGQIGLALLITLSFMTFWQVKVLAQGPTDEQLELGGRLYAENCAVCHGSDGEGRVGATLSKDWPSIRPDLRVRAAIEEGVSGSPMPAWSQQKGGPLTDKEIDALTFYILSWETGGIPPLPTQAPNPRPPITPVPEVEGDPNRGAVLYDENCAVCHGANGEGRIGARLAKDWPAIRPDLRVKTAIERGVAGSPMLAWSQTYGGPLADEDINDILAFILSWRVSETVSGPEPTPTPSFSALRGPLGVLVLVVALLALFLVGVVGALTRSRE